MIRIITLLLLIVGISLPDVQCQELFSQDITLSELFNHIAYLASDSLEGRKPGTRGGKAAADYIKKQLDFLDVQLMGNDGFQYIDIVTSVEVGDGNTLQFAEYEGRIGKNFMPLSLSENVSLSAPVVYVGYGFDFETDSLSWHDYANVDVNGKWAMMLFGDPEIGQSQSIFASYSSDRHKVLVAKDRGAAGVLFVSGLQYDEKDELTALSFDQSLSTSGLPVIHISRQVADQLLIGKNYTIEKLEDVLNQERQPCSLPLGQMVSATTNVLKKKSQTQNVVALLPGGENNLKNEIIVLGAHYDHLGFGGSNSGSRRPDTTAIHNGADDNASGVAAILEIFERLAANRKNLKRSILFLAFAAEEMGIVGSKYFVRNPLVALNDIICMLNLDMVGRLREDTQSISVGGTGTAIGLSDLVEQYAHRHELGVSLSPEGLGPSDHASFYAADIPVLFFTTGVHMDYHTPVDDVEKINIEGEKLISDFVYDLVLELANRPETLVFQEAGPKERPSVRGQFRVTLGIMPDITAGDVEGLRVEAVMNDRPAYYAGIKKGDIIVEMEGKSVMNIYDYMYRLAEFKPGQRISVAVKRNDEKVILIVEL